MPGKCDQASSSAKTAQTNREGVKITGSLAAALHRFSEIPSPTVRPNLRVDHGASFLLSPIFRSLESGLAVNCHDSTYLGGVFPPFSPRVLLARGLSTLHGHWIDREHRHWHRHRPQARTPLLSPFHHMGTQTQQALICRQEDGKWWKIRHSHRQFAFQPYHSSLP